MADRQLTNVNIEKVRRYVEIPELKPEDVLAIMRTVTDSDGAEAPDL